MLAKSRIFNTKIHTGYAHGTQAGKKRNEWLARLVNNDNNWIMPELWQPLFKNTDKAEFDRMIFEAKKLRIMMRGVKSGKKKGSS